MSAGQRRKRGFGTFLAAAEEEQKEEETLHPSSSPHRNANAAAVSAGLEVRAESHPPPRNPVQPSTMSAIVVLLF